MSSYRSYRPWNSSLSSYSSTSSPSNYRSRYGTTDGASASSSAVTSKYSSITPSSYRPSYSSTSGTYRASRAPPISSITSPSTTPSYTRTYSNLGKPSDDADKPKSYTRTYSSLGSEKTSTDEKEKPKSYTRTYSSLGTDKTTQDEKDKPKSYTRSYTSLGRSKIADQKETEKKEPSPPKRISSSSRFGSARDLSTETKTRLSSSYATGTTKKEEKKPPVTFNTRYKVTSTRGTSRDPSPSVESSGAPQTALQRLTAARDRSREPSPASKPTSIYSRSSTARSRDPSPLSRSYSDNSQSSQSHLNSSKDKINDLANQIAKSYSNNSTRDRLERTYSSKLSTRGDQSRDPSPTASRRPSITSISNSTYSRSRDPSPVDNKYPLPSYRLSNGREPSRDPSPGITLNKTTAREPSPISIISNRLLSSRDASPSNIKNRYGTTTTGYSTSSSRQKSPDASISYMTASETNTRPSRISYINRHSPQKDKVEPPPVVLKKTEPPMPPIPTIQTQPKPSESDSDSSTSSSEEEESSSEEEIKKPEPKIMIQVSTITRGTSPTPPGATTPRIRRVEVAKTIEKVRQRPLQGPPMIEKSTQSDRMDDSTRYSRFGTTSRMSYSPYSPTLKNYSSSRSSTSVSTSPRYSREPSENISAAESEKSEGSDKAPHKSVTPDRASHKSEASDKASHKSEADSLSENRSSSNRNLLSPSRISVSKERLRVSSSKSKTPDSAKVLPPQSPTKSESPKVVSKDFRKSALNMGPTDRVSRSKSSSSDNSSPTVEKTRLQFQKLLNGDAQTPATAERSSSVDSETSTGSIEEESQIEHTIIEPTKEEIISQKVEEAKSFLLKTLGNSAAYNLMKSPSPTNADYSSASQISQSCTTNYPTQSLSTKLDFSSLKKNVSGEKPWWMDDSNESQEPQAETQTECIKEHDETLKTLNGFSEMTLTQEPNNSDKSKWSWLGSEKPVNLNEKIERVQSGEKAWWCTSPENKTTSDNQAFAQNVENARSNMWEQETQADVSELQQDDEYFDNDKNCRPLVASPFPNTFDSTARILGDRASPEGLESNHAPLSPCNNLNGAAYQQDKLQDFNARPRLFISRHTNIDDLLGGSSVFNQSAFEPFELIAASSVRIHDSNSPPKTTLKHRSAENNYQLGGGQSQQTLDDAAIQVYKDGDFGAYLDLESSLVEQPEDIEGLNASRKNSLVVRTQLSVRVHSIIEKLLTSEGRELRRALFSLKQIFQEDKDLVHGFVALGGLNCLVQIGNEADQNYQNYILRALGQVMLYVDGMNGVMEHGLTVQWLYGLIGSKYRLVVKTALKLLLVFVEYCESNCYLLVQAIKAVDTGHRNLSWTHIMKLLKDYDNADTELLIYATSLINKTLSGISDQDRFYDETDYLEQQGIERIIQRYMSRADTDLDLLDQFQLYEAALRFEDGETEDIIQLADKTIRRTLRYRTSDSVEQRKSRRFSTTAPPPPPPPAPTYQILPPAVPPLPLSYMLQQNQQTADNDSSSSGGDLNGFADCKVKEGGAGVTPGLRRRRERAERQKTFQREQEAEINGSKRDEERDEYGNHSSSLSSNESAYYKDHRQNLINNKSSSLSLRDDKVSSESDSILNNNNNNKSESHSVTNQENHHPLNGSLSRNNQNEVSKYVILNYDKNTLEYKNNKNLILKQTSIELNRYDSNNKHSMNNNNINRSITRENHHNFEKHLNDINQLKKELQEKRFIVKNTPEICDNLNNAKLSKSHDGVCQSMGGLSPKIEVFHVKGTGQLTIDQASNDLKVVCSQKTNENLRAFEKTEGRPLAFDKNCSPSARTNLAAIKTNILRQKRSPTNRFVSSNGFATNENHFHGISLHESPKNTTNAKSIPCIVIQGNASDLNNKTTFNGVVERRGNSSDTENEDKKLLLQLKREQTVKDLTQKLSNLPLSPQEDKPNRIGDSMSGLISKAKEELAKNKAKADVKATVEADLKKPEPKKSEIEMHWEELIKNMDRDLMLCDLDFRDLTEDDEMNLLKPKGVNGSTIPPPPPPGLQNGAPSIPSLASAPFRANNNLNGNSLLNSSGNDLDDKTPKKTKKTVKLFWKEVREDMIPSTVERTIWDELPEATVDTDKLEHLFESRAKDLHTRKQSEINKSKEIIVLDHKRSNAINIAMTKLPPPRAIKAAILKMDSTVVTREGIEKLLNMLPTEEERCKIQDAQMLSPELPLGSAEQFLLTLSSISELSARLKLWAFRLDFENIEKEIAEPLMDLKQGIELLKSNVTFKYILSHLLHIGIFLNGQPVKGFQIEYLAKVPEVKDTVHKHSLLHHLCHMVMESSPSTSDLYSEIGPVTRASKADFSDLAQNIKYLETECKASWDRLKLISKHDTAPQLKQKLIDFLADCAERIIILDVVHRRVNNRYQKFLLWLGIPPHRISELRPNEFCRVLSEFALEYRTTRERVHQQIEKKANHRERNKTRGKLIVDIAKLKNGNPTIMPSKEEKKDAELRQLLGNTATDGPATLRRRRPDSLRSPSITNRDETLTDGDDEILESLVKATKASTLRPVQRERKRTRNADRKSLRRTLKNGLSEDEKHHIQQMIHGC